MPAVSSVVIELNRPGIGALLASDEVQRILDQRADRVATAARGRGITVEKGKGEIPVPVETISAGTSERARAIISVDHPAGLRVEAKYRLLGRALSAARGGG